MLFWRHNFLPFLWALFIGLLCLMPGKDVPDSPFFRFDLLAHGLVFGIFTFLLCVGFRKQRSVRIFRYGAAWYALWIGILYGGLLELFQGLIMTGRKGEWLDWLSDSLGSVFGILFFYWVYGNAARIISLKRSDLMNEMWE
jgi:VanZ family protein